jgi:hypothetical protein
MAGQHIIPPVGPLAFGQVLKNPAVGVTTAGNFILRPERSCIFNYYDLSNKANETNGWVTQPLSAPQQIRFYRKTGSLLINAWGAGGGFYGGGGAAASIVISPNVGDILDVYVGGGGGPWIGWGGGGGGGTFVYLNGILVLAAGGGGGGAGNSGGTSLVTNGKPGNNANAGLTDSGNSGTPGTNGLCASSTNGVGGAGIYGPLYANNQGTSTPGLNPGGYAFNGNANARGGWGGGGNGYNNGGGGGGGYSGGCGDNVNSNAGGGGGSYVIAANWSDMISVITAGTMYAGSTTSPGGMTLVGWDGNAGYGDRCLRNATGDGGNNGMVYMQWAA